MEVSDTTENSDRFKQSLLYLILAIFIVVAIYLIFQFVKLFNKPTNYVLAQMGRITNYEEAVAYVIRDEEIIDTSSLSGERQIVIADGNRAAKNDIIAYYIQGDSLLINDEIDEIDDKIQKILLNLKVDYSQDVKSIDKTIGDELYDVVSNKNNIYDLKNQKVMLLQDMEKKAVLIGKNSDNTELNTLLKDRTQLEKDLNKSKVDLKAEKAGLISYRIDGYENTLNEKSFSSVSLKYLSNIKYVTNQTVPISEDKVKLINNFYSYLVVVANSKESKELNLNDTVRVSINGDLSNYERASVEYIINDKDTKIIILKIKDNIELLSKYRKVVADLVWWNYEGIKLPDEAIYEKSIMDFYNEMPKFDESGNIIIVPNNSNKINMISVMGVTGYTKEVFVKVENSAKGFSIVSNYTDDELLELGVPKEIVNNRTKLNLYDKVVIDS